MQTSPLKVGKAARIAQAKRRPQAQAVQESTPAAAPPFLHTSAEGEELTTEASTLLAEALAGCRTPRATPRADEVAGPPPPASLRSSSGELPARLLLGISLAGIEEVLASRTDDEVTFAQTKAKRRQFDGYVNQVLCKQLSQEDGLSTCERMQQSGSPHVGHATLFVSWPFGTAFGTLVDALRRHVRESQLDEAATYFWISDFSLCLSRGLTTDLARLPEILSAIGQTGMLIDPWEGDDPTTFCAPLRRVWCLWELYLTARAGANFTTLLSTAHAEALGVALNFSFEAVLDAIEGVDVTSASTATSKDKEMILDAVARSVGHGRFNTLVRKLLLGAMAVRAHSEIVPSS